MEPIPERVAVGRVRGLHGLRGAVRVEVLTDRPEERFAPGARVMAGERILTVVESAVDGPGLRVRFREVPDRTAAESLRDLDLEVEVDPGRDLEPGAVFWHELVGVRVTDRDGRDLGVVRDVYRAGGAEIVSVGGGVVRAFEMPVVRSFVIAWTPREGSIVVDADALDLEVEAPRPPARPHRERARGADVREGEA